MVRCSLNGQWLMTNETDSSWPGKDTGSGKKTAQGSVTGTVPGSVYSFLLEAGRMEDPYYRDRELDALKRMEDDYTFSRTFLTGTGQDTDSASCCGTDSASCCGTDSASDIGICSSTCCEEGGSILDCTHQILRFEGIDTLSEVRLNGVVLGRTNNMHITWEFDVRGILRPGKNTLEVTVFSPTRFIREADKQYHLGGSDEAMRGFPHLRKAHCMFGWDWGPRLPDGGIWRDVWLEGWTESRIEQIRIRQSHLIKKSPYQESGSSSADTRPAAGEPDHAPAARESRVCVDLTVDVVQSGNLPVAIRITGPDRFEANPEN